MEEAWRALRCTTVWAHEPRNRSSRVPSSLRFRLCVEVGGSQGRRDAPSRAQAQIYTPATRNAYAVEQQDAPCFLDPPLSVLCCAFLDFSDCAPSTRLPMQRYPCGAREVIWTPEGVRQGGGGEGQKMWEEQKKGQRDGRRRKAKRGPIPGSRNC